MAKREDEYCKNINYKFVLGMLVFTTILFCCGVYYLEKQPILILLLCIMPLGFYTYIELLFSGYKLKLKKQNKDTKYIDKFATIGNIILICCIYGTIIIAMANLS